MKYIHSKTLGIVMFECRLRHDAIAAALGQKRDDITSAGCVDVSSKGIYTYGHSHALDIEHKPSDGDEIAINMRVCRAVQHPVSS